MAFGPRSRIIGVDDGPFSRRAHARVPLIAVLMQGAGRIDGIIRSHVIRDGIGASRALVQMLTGGRYANQAQAIVLDGIAFGGFNVVDLPYVAEQCGVAVLAVMRKKPDLQAVRAAISRTTGPQRRLELLNNAGPIHEALGLWFQCAGASPQVATEILRVSMGEARYPEALRVAHLVAGAFSKGTSRGQP